MPLKTKYSSPVSVRVPRQTLKDLKKLARRLGVPISQIMLHGADLVLNDPPKTLVPRPRAARGEGGEDADVFE